MIEYSLKALSADELSFKASPRPPQGTKIAIKPRFSRRISQAQENAAIHLVMLECVIEGSEEEPAPYTLTARLMGVFEVKNMQTDEDKRVFAVNATETMFPYLRAAIANITADALIPPLQLPVVPGSTLFPDDRGPGHYTLHFDPKTVN